MQPHERIAFIKVINDVIEEVELLKVRLEKLEMEMKQITEPTRHNRQMLADMLNRHFSSEDLDNLAFQLNLNGDYEGAESRIGKARQLVLACERRGMISDLVSICRAERPRASWPVG